MYTINPTLDLLRIQLSDSKLGHHLVSCPNTWVPWDPQTDGSFFWPRLAPQKGGCYISEWKNHPIEIEDLEIQHETDLEISLQFGYRIWWFGIPCCRSERESQFWGISHAPFILNSPWFLRRVSGGRDETYETRNPTVICIYIYIHMVFVGYSYSCWL